MASYEEKIKRLEDQVALLMDASSHSRRRFEDIEKQLEKSNTKLEETEGALKETMTKLAISEKKLKKTERTLNDHLDQCKSDATNVGKRIGGLEQKVLLNTAGLDKARKLQLLFRHALSEKATRAINDGDIAKIEGRISDLDSKVDGIETTCTEHSKKLREMIVYHSSFCQDVDVDQAQGILTKVGPDCWAYFMSAKPLTVACPHFSVEWLDGASGWHAIGLAPTGWDGSGELGDEGMVGYYGYGRILVSGKGVHYSKAQCRRGDVMKIALTFSPPRIEIRKNHTLRCNFVGAMSCGVSFMWILPHLTQIYSQELGPEFKDKSLHAVVQLVGQGSKVKLLETDPWRA